MGIKIVATGLEKALAGTGIMVVGKSSVPPSLLPSLPLSLSSLSSSFLPSLPPSLPPSFPSSLLPYPRLFSLRFYDFTGPDDDVEDIKEEVRLRLSPSFPPSLLLSRSSLMLTIPPSLPPSLPSGHAGHHRRDGPLGDQTPSPLFSYSFSHPPSLPPSLPPSYQVMRDITDVMGHLETDSRGVTVQASTLGKEGGRDGSD